MSLIHLDGFDLQDTLLRPTLTWVTSTGSSWSTTTRFSYGAALGIRDGTQMTKLFTPVSQIWMGYAWQHGTGHTHYLDFYTDGGATQQVRIFFNSDGSVTVYRGTVTSIATLPATSFASGWNYIEISVSINATTGIVKIRKNGATSDLLSFSGNTKNGGTSSSVDALRFTGDSSGGYTYIDDLYICDTGGSTNNSFLGDVRVYTLSPSGNGTYSAFVNSAGNSTNNYTYVDEQPYATSDYVGSATPGNKDSYAMADLPAGVTTIFGVQQATVAAKSDAGLAQLKHLVRISSTDYASSSNVLSTTYNSYLNLMEQNPNTSAAWTNSDVNGIEAGVQVG